jgi:ATP-dependent RNA helicase DeaD
MSRAFLSVHSRVGTIFFSLMQNESNETSFAELGLPTKLCEIIKGLGYEAPTPIQVQSIPVLLKGRDLIGQAQTGTGKTAAFALPLITTIKPGNGAPQVLVLAPTRELAIQVAEAFKSYAKHLKGFQVLPLYGGQSIVPQLKQLQREPQVIVGTPGRVMDHLRRGSLSLENINSIVLDEADEMLSMGFLEDIQWIIEQAPETRQTVLFSATMPKAIKSVAERYLRDPEHIVIGQVSKGASLIDQSHWLVSGLHKLDALTRLLEVSDTDGTLVFVRTKTTTVELAEKLEARGYAAAALSGDLTQEARERTIAKLKKGTLDIIVATDVAARGLDVERINMVINYDIPFDGETYTHRIGRTGRAGRTGTAILFVSPRERGLLRSIERTIGKPIPPLKMPTREDLALRRTDKLFTKIDAALQHSDIGRYQAVVERLVEKSGAEPLALAAALCSLINEQSPILVDDSKNEGHASHEERPRSPRGEGRSRDHRSHRGPRSNDDRPRREKKFDGKPPRKWSKGEKPAGKKRFGGKSKPYEK